MRETGHPRHDEWELDVGDRCYSCAREADVDSPARERVAYDELWRVVHATGSALPGWLVLLPRRHVEELVDLTEPEVRTLGTWQVRLARALTAEFDAPKTYVAAFGEKPGFHLHFHVVPRPADLAPELRGPGSFGFLDRTPETGELTESERDGIAGRLAARLG